jgi:hypothetical protein
VRKHASRLPVVIPARLGRTFEVYRPAQGIGISDFVENRGTVASRAAQWSFYVLGLASIAGAVMYRRRRVPLLPCLAMFASVVITTVLTYGNVRFRIELDTVLPLLAAMPVAALAAIPIARLTRRVPSGERAETVPVGEGGPSSER